MANGTTRALAGITMELLWTNPSPTSSFSPQTVGLDLSNYDMLCVVLKHYTDSNTRIVQFVPIFDDKAIMSYNDTSGTRIVRQAKANSSGVTFENGISNGSSNNSVAIPYQIYGIKGIN